VGIRWAIFLVGTMSFWILANHFSSDESRWNTRLGVLACTVIGQRLYLAGIG
jgi:hypothetical protein